MADQIFQQMESQGQSFYSAAGDSDAFSGLIPFPDDSPYITIVGGTELTMSGTGGAYQSEEVWNRDNGVGTGGGPPRLASRTLASGTPPTAASA